jgi:hypothetical protein
LTALQFVSGIEFLQSLKELNMKASFEGLGGVENVIAANKNKPDLKTII